MPSNRIFIMPNFALTGWIRADVERAVAKACEQFNYTYWGYGARYELVTDPQPHCIYLYSGWNGTNNYAQWFPRGSKGSPNRLVDLILINSQFALAYDPFLATVQHELGHPMFGNAYQHTYFPEPKLKPVEPAPIPAPNPPPMPDPIPPPKPKPDPKPDPVPKDALWDAVRDRMRLVNGDKGVPANDINAVVRQVLAYIEDWKKDQK